MSKVPVIKRVEVNRSLLGKIDIRFECPRCKNSLICEREEIGTADDCPHCGQRFMVAEGVELKLQAEEDAKDQAKIDAQQKREAKRRQKNEERLREQEEQQRLAELQLDEEPENDFPEKDYQPEDANYSNLETIALVVRFSAYLSMIIASCVFIFQLYSFALAVVEEQYLGGVVILGWGVGQFTLGVITFIFMMAISESIKLAVNVANDVRSIRIAAEQGE